MGFPCSFYHEGGRGQNYWARGWRYGFIHAIPMKGQHKGWIQIEVRVPGCEEKAWVSQWNVNEPGDCTYHGPLLKELVAERQAAKRLQQAKADKKRRKSKA